VAQDLEVLFFEAESAILHGSVRIGEDDAASNGSYIWSPPASSLDSTFFDYSEFRFTVKTPGIYLLSAGVHAGSTDSDTAYVKVNTGKTYVWYVTRHGIFDTDYANNRGGKDLGFKLGVGETTVRIYTKEPGLRLDWVALQLATHP